MIPIPTPHLCIIGSDGRTLAYRPSCFTFGNVLESLAALGPFLSLNQHLVSVDDVETFGG